MDRTLSSIPGFDPREHVITEVDVAIEMVARGAAEFEAAVRAQAADVAFTLKRDGPRSITMIVGLRPESDRPRSDSRPDLARTGAPAPQATA